ncbi:uncharacterized protein [Acropora muricata]|uniref:uncharacterized protein isoform X2 n=1 Tax=Acropora muricata TaxID=159855 RepID=UPI0034E5FF3A
MITQRSLGIYNKAKRSDTISRENSKQKLCKKKFEDIRMKTERDMARVLDCSSFKIQHPSCSFPSGSDSPVYSNNSARMDYPTPSPVISHRSHSSCSSSGRYSNPEKNKITPHQRSTPQKLRSHNEAGLAFKTPLQEISQRLTEALWPAETFHGRDYLAEVQGQLRKMYKQSSVSSHIQKMESNAGIASEFQKRCLKRKSVEENNTGSTKTATNEEKVQTAVEDLSDHLARCKRQSTSNSHQIISSADSKHQDTFLQSIPFRDSRRGTLQSSEYFDLQATFPSTVTRHDKGKEMDFPSGREVQRCLFGQSEASLATTTGQAQMFSHNSISPDILDFLDGVEHTQEHRRCITPDPRLVSPPKKPTLDSLTPEKKFYPHKLY